MAPPERQLAASSVKRKKLNSSAKELEAEVSIRIEREEHPHVDKWRAYSVVLDGHKIGSIRRGEAQSFSARPGDHEIWVAIDWCRSPKLMMSLVGGESIDLECAGRQSIRKAVLSWIFRPRQYLTLRRA